MTTMARTTVLLAAAAMVAAGIAAAPPASAATSTISGTIQIQGAIGPDDNALVFVEQQLPAGARGAAFDDADGSWYDSFGQFVATDGITPGHFSIDLAPGVYRITAFDGSKVYEQVVDLRAGSVTVNPTLNDALDCPIRPVLQPNPSLVGVAQTVTVAPFSPGYPTQVTYQWYRQDPADPNPNSAYTRIDGARASSYTLTAADIGKRVAVDVSGLSQHGNVTCQSTDSGIVVAAPSGGPALNPTTFPRGVTKPIGVPRVGKRLRAPALVGAPATTKVTYQWYREGAGKHPGTKPIPGARLPVYRLRKADLGAPVYLVITLTDPAYPTRQISTRGVRVRR